MEEVEGIILGKGYDDKMKYYNGWIGNTDSSYFILIDSQYGKRLIAIPKYSPYENEINGLDKLLEEGATVSFFTRNPDQPVHWKKPHEVIIKKAKEKKTEIKFNYK